MAAPDHKKKSRLANSVKGKQPCKQRSHDGNGSTGAVLWGCSQSVNATVRKHTGGHCVRYFSNCVSVYEVLTVIAIKARSCVCGRSWIQVLFRATLRTWF